jgi:hypothetical protein
VIAGIVRAAHITIDARGEEPRRCFLAQQEMIDAQTGIARRILGGSRTWSTVDWCRGCDIRCYLEGACPQRVAFAAGRKARQVRLALDHLFRGNHR